jgi:phenylalanyl-tRNA synthetase beta chain
LIRWNLDEDKPMRVPLEWLKQFVDVKAEATEIGERLTMGGLEVEGIETDEKEFPLVPILDVYVTPNRGDCLSLLGVGREVAALYGLPLQMSAIPAASGEGDPALVTIEAPDLCPRYAARIVRNVKIGPSPDWMQARLLSAGMRPINNVVDVTNYVMLELGQPLHAFDLDRLEDGRIVVRRALPGESLTTLDGVERELSPEMLVIADTVKPVAIAGVMGGESSEVSDVTANLLIESAHFQPLTVRRTSRTLGLRTEASYRFERVVDPAGVARAANRACQLLAEMGAGDVEPTIVDVYPAPADPRHLTLRPGRASELLGMDISVQAATECLQRLEFGVQSQGHDGLLVTVPSFRADITLEEDLVEEVGRIYGYENIPETLPFGAATAGGDSAEGRLIRRIKDLLTSCGLQEVVTHSLTAPSFFDSPEDAKRRVPVRNALSSEVSRLRRSLIPTLLDVAQHNAAHGRGGMALFEVGRVWQQEETLDGVEPREYVAVAGLLTGPLTPGAWQEGGKGKAADYGLARGVVERLLSGLQIHQAEFLPPASFAAAGIPRFETGQAIDLIPQFHPGRAALIRLIPDYPADGVVGELHPKLAADLALRDRIYLFEVSLEALRSAMPAEEPRFRTLPRFPAVGRDLAPRLPVETPYAAVRQTIASLQLPLLEEFRLTDVFTGAPLPEGVKSLTLAFTFRSEEGTLKDNEVTEALAQIRTALETNCGAAFTG